MRTTRTTASPHDPVPYGIGPDGQAVTMRLDGAPRRPVSSVFPHTTDRASVDRAHAAPGTVYVDLGNAATYTQARDVAVRVVGSTVHAIVGAPDAHTGRHRIVVFDLLADDVVRVDTWAAHGMGAREAVALAEGMVRGLTMAQGIALDPHAHR